ncbi:hypothetical protein L208DRAFT_1374816 [Tricholoma matsutake]|nr:hypothetical protein L208DRAFT_1374816 [Tricholoma matsutake 945]
MCCYLVYPSQAAPAQIKSSASEDDEEVPSSEEVEFFHHGSIFHVHLLTLHFLAVNSKVAKPTIAESESEQDGKVLSLEALFNDDIEVDDSGTQDLIFKATNRKVKLNECTQKEKAELPVVDQSLGKKLKEKKTVTTVNSKEWPGHAQLVPPPSGKDLWLNDQHPLLQFVIQEFPPIVDIYNQIAQDIKFCDALGELHMSLA